MRKLFSFWVLVASFFLSQAQVKISALPAASDPVGTEVLPMVQGGVTKKVTVNQIRGGSALNWLTTGNTGLGLSNFVGTTDPAQLNFAVNSILRGYFQQDNITGGGRFVVLFGDSCIENQGVERSYHSTRNVEGSYSMGPTMGYVPDTTTMESVRLRVGENINDHGAPVCYDLYFQTAAGNPSIWHYYINSEHAGAEIYFGDSTSFTLLKDTAGCTFTQGIDTVVRINVLDKTFQYKPGSEGLNKVLTSDANGVASWQSLTAIAACGSGNEFQYNNGTGGLGCDTSAYRNDSLTRIGRTYGDAITSIGNAHNSTWIDSCFQGVVSFIATIKGQESASIVSAGIDSSNGDAVQYSLMRTVWDKTGGCGYSGTASIYTDTNGIYLNTLVRGRQGNIDIPSGLGEVSIYGNGTSGNPLSLLVVNGDHITFGHGLNGSSLSYNRYSMPTDTATKAGMVITSTGSIGNWTSAWQATAATPSDSATIYALTPSEGTFYYCNNCTGSGITGRIVAYIGAAWRRLTFE